MNQQQARRSERLRRKRQSTPGLSQPGNYSLYNKGYVVESEASFLPEVELPKRTPASNRRIRYKDSPHVYDTSPIVVDAEGQDGEEGMEGMEGNGRQNVMQRVRVSLFDILGSGTRQPVNSTWRAAARSRVNNARGEGQAGAEEEEEVVVEDNGMESTVRNLGDEFDDNGGDDTRTGRRSATPVMVLVGLLIGSMCVMGLLDGIVRSRSGGGASAWRRLSGRCAAAGGLAVDGTKRILDYLRRPTLQSGRVPAVVGMTRAEFEAEVLPGILREARKTAAEEATRVSRISGREWQQRSGDGFGSFVERFAGDKDLPPDFALGSMGGSIIYSRPSAAGEWVRWARGYVVTLVGNGRRTAAAPRRARRILEAGVLPGECWAFPGSVGEVGIRLPRAVRVRSVTMEHTPRGSVVSTDSAPRRFGVSGLVVDGGVVELGEFEFDVQRGHLQTFGVGERDEVLRGVVLRVVSNWGARHTAVYRFRVHGEQVPLDEL